MTDDFMRRAKRGEEMRLESLERDGVLRQGHRAPYQLGGL